MIVSFSIAVPSATVNVSAVRAQDLWRNAERGFEVGLLEHQLARSDVCALGEPAQQLAMLHDSERPRLEAPSSTCSVASSTSSPV
jgi:hypothetical protein